MPNENEQISKLVGLIEAAFPTEPRPPYPELMGLDPIGVKDEYAPFADRAWSDVDAYWLTWAGLPGYDISPAIGFRLHSPPHLWNYFVPAFMRASLVHEGEYDIIDGFLWSLEEVYPHPRTVGPDDPWWAGQVHFEGYSLEQAQCVVHFLEWIKVSGCSSPWEIEWEQEPKLQRCLERWRERVLVESGQE